jgi:peptidoglycan/xylan/chitin deacetylase (PgdA/CDA1 family)
MRKVKLAFLFVCKSLGLFRIMGWVTRHRLRILCYHGFSLSDDAAFRPKLFMSMERFERRLQSLRRYRMQVIPLDEAIERLYARCLPVRSTVITVDDGFHSFYELAVPCLKRHGFPATVYVTTYYVRKGAPVFRLVVQYMFWKTTRRSVALVAVPWTDDQSVDLTNTDETAKVMWKCIQYGEQQCTEEQRCEICAELGFLLAVSYDQIVASRSLHLMTPEELRSLAAADISVGLHTHRHRFPADDRVSAEREIAENRAELDRCTGRTASHFCYPSGLWAELQWEWLQDLHIKSSTTCVAGLNSAKTPRHALRRLLDGDDVHELEFEAALCGLSDLLRAATSVRFLRRPA